MQAEVIAIGSELTSGHTVNTNAAYLARRLQELGIPCSRQMAVSDEPPLIVETLRQALRRADLILVTGGLGPTFDDVTVEAIVQATGRRLVFAPRAAETVRRFYRQHHRRLNTLALRQAYVPAGATPLPNPVGTAPGLWLPLDGRLLIALPGVPREMRGIMEHGVLPRLRRAHTGLAIVTRTLRTVGLVELQIQERLRTMQIPSSVQLGLYPNLMAVDVRLTVSGTSPREAQRTLTRLERTFRRRLAPAVYGADEETLESAVGEALARRRRTLAIAESCTGGLVADRLTNVAGSSRYFLLSTVVYDNRMKERLLDVSPAQLARDGAVSGPVARAMAQGVRRLAGADVGLSITGIAGPTGGSRHKPVGLVYIGLADRARCRLKRYRFHGDRLAIKHQTAQMALEWLRRWGLGLD